MKVTGTSTTAPLQNVAICDSALMKAMERSAHLPGMVCFYGPSGWGKSSAAAYAANVNRAYYVEAKSSWTRKALLIAILREMGVEPDRTIYELTDQVSEQLVLSQRPLIVDEMDHLVDRNAVEVVRDIYEGSNAAILLIGEEMLPTKLKRWERFHGRMLHWAPAQPASYDDALLLRDLYRNGVGIEDDLLARIHELSKGSVRRICVNLERVAAEGKGKKNIGLDWWGERDLFTGEAPVRRV